MKTDILGAYQILVKETYLQYFKYRFRRSYVDDTMVTNSRCLG